MRNTQTALLLALFAWIAQSCAPAQNPYFTSCGKAPKLELVSLAMFPDPLPEARKIDQWRAVIRSDGSDLCETALAVRQEGKGQSITLQTRAELSLGQNHVLLYADENYRLSGGEVCFEMSAHIGGKNVPIETARRFCARTIDRGWWSMR